MWRFEREDIDVYMIDFNIAVNDHCIVILNSSALVYNNCNIYIHMFMTFYFVKYRNDLHMFNFDT